MSGFNISTSADTLFKQAEKGAVVDNETPKKTLNAAPEASNDERQSNTHEVAESPRESNTAQKKAPGVSQELVGRIISLHEKFSALDSETASFVFPLLSKEKFNAEQASTTPTVYTVVTMSNQDIEDAYTLYKLILVRERVERVFSLLSLPVLTLKRLGETASALGGEEVTGKDATELSKTIESNINALVVARGVEFFDITKDDVLAIFADNGVKELSAKDTGHEQG